MANPREYTCRLLEMVDGGILSADDVMNVSVRYMSDSGVEDMMRLYQWDDMLVDESTEESDSVSRAEAGDNPATAAHRIDELTGNFS